MKNTEKSTPYSQPETPTQPPSRGEMPGPEATAREQGTLFGNQLMFDYPVREITVGVYKQEDTGLQRFHYNKLPEKVTLPYPELNHDNPFVWLGMEPGEDDIKLQINLAQYPWVAKWYFYRQLYDQLAGHFRLVSRDFVWGMQFWEEDKQANRQKYIAFRKFTLRILPFEEEFRAALMVSFEGYSYVVKYNLQNLFHNTPLKPEMVGRVVYEKSIRKYRFMPDSWRRQTEKIYPVLRRQFAPALNISYPNYMERYKLKRNYEAISRFYERYLLLPSVLQVIPHQQQWRLAEECRQLTLEQPVMEFGNGGSTNDVMEGLRNYGPAVLPQAQTIKYFFIYNAHDSEWKDTLQKHITGEQGFIPPGRLSRLLLKHEQELDVEIAEGEYVATRVQQAMHTIPAEGTDTAYFAFYLSPYGKWEQVPERRKVYYQVKEALLRRGIMSQALETAKMNQRYINLWIPNIAIAMVAKLGGVPWRFPQTTHDLVVGFGAYHVKDRYEGYVGSTFCFDNQGNFKEMDCWPVSEAEELHGRLADAIERYRRQMGHIDRVIVHYYKKLKKRDLDRIDEMIDSLDADIPVIVVRVNNTFENDYLFFEPNHPGLLPADGTYVRLKAHTYLLYINDNAEDRTCKSAPLPLRLSLQSNRAGLLDDEELVNELMEQVYAFSLLHWRSIKQPRIPVTIDYPRMLARVFPYLDTNVLMGESRKRLWLELLHLHGHLVKPKKLNSQYEYTKKTV